MTTKADEDELLRSAALQNATTILIARQRAERRSEAYLAEAQRLSHTGSFGWKPATGEIFWSAETFRIFQYEQTATRPTVELILQRVHPEDAALVKQTIERASQDGKDFDFKHRLLMPDGSVKYVHVVAQALNDDSGDIEFVGAVMDVTTTKQAEDALQRSESYLAEAQRLTHTGSWAWRVAERGALHLSEEWYRIYGFDPKEGLSAWEKRVQRMHPDDRAKWRETTDRAIREKSDYDVEMRILLPDGTVKHTHTVGHPILNASGDVVQFMGTMVDVTERKRAEEALRRSESYLAEAQKLTHTGSWAWRVGGQAIHLSEEWYRINGFDPEKGFLAWEERLQRIHPQDRAKWQDAIDQAVREKSDYEVQYRILLADGTVKYVHTVGHPVLNASEDSLQFVGSSTDITDRKQAEMLLAGEKQLLEMIARGDPRAAILDALCRLVEEQAVGSLPSILLFDSGTNQLRHGAAPSLPALYTKAIDGAAIGPSAGSCGTAAYRAETVIVSDIATDPLWADYRDLALTHALRACWSRPILSSEGKVLGTFAIYYREPRSPTAQEHDLIEQISHLASIALEREQAEAVLRQAQADLAHMNRVTTMGELTASLAHEVNQPIAAVVTNADACLRWLAGDSANLEEARAAVTRIARDGTRAAEIISRIRLLFKKHAPQTEAVDVNEIIREMIVLLRSEVTRYSISVRAEQAADLPQVMGDRVQLQQVLMNLMINGIDATKDANGTRELSIKSQQWKNEQVMVSVSDTGVGLPPQQADQIFNAFFTTKPHGIGMGLSISRSIIEAHGGRLWVGDNSPRGASFHFTLPTKVEAHD